jgi:predicted RNA-binding protein YlqC (UPF0109 family)
VTFLDLGKVGSVYFQVNTEWAKAPIWESIMPTEQSGDVRQLVLDMAKALVDQPDLVTVEAIDGPESTVLELRVAQRDLGKVIGKQGRTARSLRTIIGAASMKLHKRHTLEIIEDGLPGGASSGTQGGAEA